MLKILINAYACAPNMGSEPGMAWNWIINLAKYCQLHVITEGEWKEEIETEIKQLSQGGNITFYYNPVSDKIRSICWNQGDWRFYYYYRKWQLQTLNIAKKIIHKENINIVHQLNMIGFREPGFLWKINKPFVWGPIDAKEEFPVEYLNGASLKQKVFIRLKNNLTKIQFQNSTRVKATIKKADVILGASYESVKSVKKYYNRDAILLNETGCSTNSQIKLKKNISDKLHLLWVGKFDFRKQLGLALQTIHEINNKSVILHIVGIDEELSTIKYKSLCEKLKIEDQILWHGKLTHANVQLMMRQCDLLFFTSVAEGTPHVVLESISNRLPVLCFNVCGQGDSINEKVGIKIPLSNPNQSVKDFSEKINFIYNNRNILSSLSNGCEKRQQELSWENKAQQLINKYKSILKEDLYQKNKFTT